MTLPPLDVPSLLRRHHLRPDKKLGQNFLVDTHALQQVVTASELKGGETVLEVGAGLGSLTRLLAQHARSVVAVELDGRLIPVLEEILAPFINVRLVHGDILQLDPASLVCETGAEPKMSRPNDDQPYLVAANIPYYITSALLRHLLEAPVKPSRLILTVQEEVAARITAQTGQPCPSSSMSLLALSVQVYGSPRVMGHIPAGAFYPVPQVDSAVVRVDLYPQPLFPPPVLDVFFRLAKAGFSQKRKTLRNSLAAGLGMAKEETASLLESAGIDPQRRAETLSLEEWRSLAVRQLAAHLD
jgi:16S rRNA (adenine1518-N6/adenine1519-N6)-dimethyltransferase